MIQTLRQSVDAAIEQRQWDAAWTQLKRLSTPFCPFALGCYDLESRDEHGNILRTHIRLVAPS